MIHRFTIRNYKSIFDLCVDFSFAEGKAPNGYRELEQLVFCEPKKGRRLVRDYERRLDVSESMIQIAMASILLKRFIIDK